MDKKQPINVLHISSGDLWAGAEVQLFTLAKSLANSTDTKVDVILFNHGRLEQELLDNNINAIVIDETKLNGLQILLQIIHTIKVIRPDVIHTHRTKENILGCTAALLTGGIPSLRTAHGAPEHKLAWLHIQKHLILFIDWFCGRFLQRKIVAVSNDLAGILQKSFPANKIEVIENGIDITSIIESVKPEKPDKKTSATPFKVGVAGRLVPVKRVDLFIRAAGKLLNDHPELNISFHIFGDGPLHTSLEMLNQKQKTEDKIHFEGHSKNMQQELANLDTLVITSDHEGLPMILLEAMVLQVPVITHAVGGIPRVLNQGNCGVLVLEHQPASYADEIYKLAVAPTTRNKLSRKAYDRVKCFYSSKKNARSYYGLYKHLIR